MTPLGFSGDDVLETWAALAPGLVLRWDSGEPNAVSLAFDAQARATVIERVPAGPDVACASPVLRLDVNVTLSSAARGTLGTWQTQLFAESRDRFAGVGTASAAALDSTLLVRSGSPDALRLTYEMADGQLRGWLTVGSGAGRIVAAF